MILRTHIADPAPTKRDSSKAHGEPLGAEEVRRTKEIMGWPDEPWFYVPEDALDHWREAVSRGAALEAEWRARLTAYATEDPEPPASWTSGSPARCPTGWDARAPGHHSRPGAAGHAAGLGPGASGDRRGRAQPRRRLGGPGRQHRHHAQAGRHARADDHGRTFHWGVREHGMAACLNGIAAHGGLRGFGSTFLVFSDYMKPAIRLAAIMRLPVIYIGTHDSIGLGEDGPTHQPIEQLAMLRATPNLVVLRPADAGETIEAWRAAMARRSGPTLLVLTRQKLPVLDRASLGAAAGTAQGAYVLLDPPGGTPQAILIASGSEVHVALGRGQGAPGRSGARARGLDALVGAVRRAARGLSKRSAAAGRTGAPRHRGGEPVRLGAVDRGGGRHARHGGLRRIRPRRPIVPGVQVHRRARRGDGPAAARPEVRMTGTAGPPPNPLVRLGELGQSPWYDYITRDLVATGELARLIARGWAPRDDLQSDDLREGDRREPAVRRRHPGPGRRGPEFRRRSSSISPWPTCGPRATLSARCYEATGGGDGLVSLEVSPTLANDTAATIHEAERLWRAVDRPNAMIKIPGTPEGLPAITHCIAAGVSVNVTLLFSVERYGEVIEAFLAGLERRLEAGLPIGPIASVASFFVSRVDGKVDPLLDQMGDPKRLRGRIAIANACAAYRLFEWSLGTPRWDRLAKAGARPQRPLWASTSTKDPRYSDVHYVEALVAPRTVNTLPPETFAAYRDHGRPAVRIGEGMIEAPALLQALATLGIDLAAITRELETDGVAKFAASYASVLAGIEAKAGALAPADAARAPLALAHLVDLHRDDGRHRDRVAGAPGSASRSSRSRPPSSG